MKEDLAPEIREILRAQEMRGEILVNHIRMGFYLLSAAMLAASAPVNRPEANVHFAVQVGTMLVFSGAMYAVLLGTRMRYLPVLKYVAITVDIVALHYSAVAMSLNHSGIIEYFQSFVPLVIVLWNMMAALRYRVAPCIWSGVLSLVLGAAVLAYTVSAGLLEVSHVSRWGVRAINLTDESSRVVFIALPAFVAAVIARISRNLILRAEQESMKRAQLEKAKERLSKYLSKELTELVLEDPALFQLGGTRRHSTILFSDIRNFTPFAESRQPEEVVAVLNDYFTEMVHIVFRYGGTLDKFLGDGLMAVFGVPFEQEDSALRATLCALDMVKTVEARLGSLGDDPEQRLRIGVGIATGPVVAGNIGSMERMEYTCIGDTVNFAARLEALNRSLGTNIVMCEHTRKAVAGLVPTRALPPIAVRGKRGEPQLYAIDVDTVALALIENLRLEVESRGAAATAERVG